ncbi:MAG: 5'-nucleotidase C-terminal domain-containing protein [Gemmatimonadaceae bacterium]|nr:5'-nucleotidase C-terminal domain-containing protein [Gemmatimonadaceae bacterium]
MKLPKLLYVLAAGIAGCAPVVSTGNAPEGVTLDLVVLGTTDVHGHLRGWDYFANAPQSREGLSRAATVIDSLRAANPGHVLVFDAGDLLQGTPLTYVPAKVTPQHPHPVVAAMNAVGYDASAIGNHEFNYGIGFLDSAIAGARFPFLSANTRRLDGGPAYKGWTMIDRGGVKVGVIGLTTPGVVVWDADKVKGKLILDDLVATAKRVVPEVRAAGADVVVALVHSGLSGESSYDESTGIPPEDVSGRIAGEVSGIDLLIYGHSHRSDSGTVIGQTLVVQPKNWATSVSAVTLSLARANGKWGVVSRKSTLIPVENRAESQAVLTVTEQGHKLAMQYANAVIGNTALVWKSDSARLRDMPISDFVLEVERKFTGADLASGSVFNTNAVLGPGPLTVAQVAQVYPYENTLKVIRITGKQLREYLDFSSRFYPVIAPGTSASAPLAIDPKIPGYNFDIVSGVAYTMDLSRPFGERITSLTYKGKPVAPGDTFSMAINNYRQSGGGGYSMIQSAQVIRDTQTEIRQLLIDEVKQKGTLRVDDYFTPSWRIVRGAAAQVTGPRLRVISTNDFHGALVPGPDAQGVVRGGAAYVARAIETARAECTGECVSILVDGGDLFQGTAVSNLTQGRAVVEYYNKMRYDAVVVGNHEFDWGVDTLRARMRQSNFPYLGVNVRYTDGRDVPWIPNDTIIQRGKWKIGVIGFASVITASTTISTNVTGLRFDAPAPIIDSVARVMRAKGADVIVAVEHDGGFCDRVATTGCSGEIFKIVGQIKEKIDLMVSGHSHSLVNTVVNGIPIVQARSSGRAIAVVDIPLPRTGELSAMLREIGVDSMRPVAGIDSIVSRAVAAIGSKLNEKITTIAVDLPRSGSQYPLGNIVADAFRWAGKADFGITNTAGVRAPLRAGPVTFAQLFEVQPFGNNLFRVQMRGFEFKEYLERILGAKSPGVHVSGFTVTYNPEGAAGSRVTSVLLPEGRTLSDAAMYTVVINDFMLGNDPYAIRDKSMPVTPIPFTDQEATIKYLRVQRQPLAIPADARIVQVIE